MLWINESMKSNNWEIIEGKIPVLLVAAHNCPHIREGRQKPRDVGTGDLVKLLCEKTGAWGIYTTCIQDDPNWHADSPFRLAVKNLIQELEIKAVIDLHGRREGYPYLIEYLPNEAFKEKYPLKDATIKELLKGGQFTLPKDLQLMGIPCTAIEIRKDGRLYDNNPDSNYEKTKSEILKLIEQIII